MNEIQTHIFSVVDTALAENVYGFVPQDEQYPFVVVGALNVNMRDTDTELGFSGFVYIRVYSKDRTTINVSNMQDSIYTALHQTKVDLTNYAVTAIQQLTRVIEMDGDIHIGYQRFKVEYEEI